MRTPSLLRWRPRLALAAIVLHTVLFPATAQDWEWARSGGGGMDQGLYDDVGYGVALDASGNAYVTGSFWETATFGPFTLKSDGGLDAFLVKYSPEGEVLWAEQDGGTGWEYGLDLAIDASGNVYVTGLFQETATFGPFTLTSAGDSDVFVAKYSAGGDVLWARSAGGIYSDTGYDVAVDAAGNAYVTGEYSGTATFGPFTLTGDGSADVFVAKYSAAGDVMWVWGGGDHDYDVGYGVAADASGNAYVIGGFLGTITFGAITLTDAGNGDVFVAKFSPEGDALWAHRGGGTGGATGLGVAVDAAASAYVTGTYSRTATFGPFNLTTIPAPDNPPEVFVVKYSSGGDELWAQRVGGVGWDSGDGITVDPAGGVYVTGYYSKVATFGTSTLLDACQQDVYVVKYSPVGDVVWVSSGSTEGDSQSYGVAVDAAGGVYVTGRFRRRAAFGHAVLSSQDGSDVFVAKLDASLPVPLVATPVSPPVVIPPGGGSFDFAVTLSNTSSESQTFEVWTAVTRPRRREREPILGPQSVTLSAGATETLTFTQGVEATMYPGTYTYHVRAGAFPCTVAASASFAVVKEAGTLAVSAESDGRIEASLSGWADPVVAAVSVEGNLPGEPLLSGARPNPFSAATRLALTLSEASTVRLSVYDVLGREVAVLVDRELPAGQHEAVLDGSSLPVGTYVVRLEVAGMVITRRAALVR